MRFAGTAYRANDPRWSFRPLSGEGAAIHGGRFNPQGTAALYLALAPMTAIKEANQGFSFKIDPCVLCSYAVDCEDIVDLRDDAALAEHRIAREALACGWLRMAMADEEPPTWRLASRLIASGAAGVLAPSFAPGATLDDAILVLWSGSELPPHQCAVHDPSGRLPKDQLSWPSR